MASHAHDPGGSSISAVKMGGIAVALITTVGGIIVAVVNQVGSVDVASKGATASQGPTPTISTATNQAQPDAGLRFSPLINGKLTVSGSAEKDVIGMYVVIGPKLSGGYDTGCGNVVDQRWQAEVATDPSWPQYGVVTVPAYGSCVVATRASAYKFTFQGTEPTTPPPPPPNQVLDCAAQFGPSCFNGPGFGPPSTYQPKQ